MYGSFDNVNVKLFGVATKGSVAVDIVRSVSGHHVKTCRFEVLPWHIPHVYVHFIRAGDNKVVVDVGVVGLELLDEECDRPPVALFFFVFIIIKCFEVGIPQGVDFWFRVFIFVAKVELDECLYEWRLEELSYRSMAKPI